jgi:hypothetical protein
MTVMTVALARATAADWVHTHAAAQDGFRGAYLAGSTVTLPAEAPLPTGSDVDIMVVIAGQPPRHKLGKFRYRDTLLEVSYLPADTFSDPQRLLTDYHVATGLRRDTIIADPTGLLRRAHRAVAAHFADHDQVLRRCAGARDVIVSRLTAIDDTRPWHEQVIGWLFGTGVSCHVLLVAALRNPTVRLRYQATRQVLAEYDRLAEYSPLLRQLGCHDWTAQRATGHLNALAACFDAAASAARTPFPFSSDISTAARPIAIDGSRELIDTGWHRETVFWTVATFARCHAVLATDAPRAHREHAPAFDAVLADLGVRSTADLRSRSAATLEYLPRLWRTAEAIVAGRPGQR